jgi:putative tryptophan/tyrosine transport system substrate-binding protein
MTAFIGRREFIALVGGAAAAWPLTARAQQDARVRRICALMGWSQNDPEFRSRFSGFLAGLAQRGWVEGRNIQIEQWWTDGDISRARIFAKQIIERNPEVIFSGTTPATAALHQEMSTIPIVFSAVSDPVGAGFVGSLARPGHNITGFTNVEAGMGGKWVELLKEIAPAIERVAIMFNPDTAPAGGNYFLASFKSAAGALSIEPNVVRVHSLQDIETAITSSGHQKAGLVVMTDSFLGVHHQPIIALAAREKVPAVFEPPFFIKNGGLLSYGVDYVNLFERAAGHVDRILRGGNPADLPVELPTKFELRINLKTAKALSLEVPPTLLARADEVIE